MRQPTRRSAEDGFVLIGVLFLVVVILIMLAMAAPKIATSIKRDKELELYHRGMQYTRAIKLYYKKFGALPDLPRSARKHQQHPFPAEKVPRPIHRQARLAHDPRRRGEGAPDRAIRPAARRGRRRKHHRKQRAIGVRLQHHSGGPASATLATAVRVSAAAAARVSAAQRLEFREQLWQ